MTPAPTLTPIRLTLAEVASIEAEEVDYHGHLATRWREIDDAARTVRAQRQLIEFGRSTTHPAHAGSAWLLVACAWLCLFIVTLIHH